MIVGCYYLMDQKHSCLVGKACLRFLSTEKNFFPKLLGHAKSCRNCTIPYWKVYVMPTLVKPCLSYHLFSVLPRLLSDSEKKVHYNT